MRGEQRDRVHGSTWCRVWAEQYLVRWSEATILLSSVLSRGILMAHVGFARQHVLGGKDRDKLTNSARQQRGRRLVSSRLQHVPIA
jgi:hypothetical protein